jgi:hypothetical protein
LSEGSRRSSSKLGCSRDLSDREEEEDDEEGRVVEDTQVVRRFVMQLGIAIAVRQGLFINESGWLSTGSIQTTVYATFFAPISGRRGAPSEVHNTARGPSASQTRDRGKFGTTQISSPVVLCE